MIYLLIAYIFLAVVLYFLDTRESFINRAPYLQVKNSLIKMFYILLLPLKIISRIKYYKHKTSKCVVAMHTEKRAEIKKMVGKFLEELLNGVDINKPIAIDELVNQALNWVKKEKSPLYHKELDKELNDFVIKVFNKQLEREKMIKNSLQEFALQVDSKKSLDEQFLEWENKENLNLSNKERGSVDIESLKIDINRNKIFKRSLI